MAQMVLDEDMRWRRARLALLFAHPWEYYQRSFVFADGCSKRSQFGIEWGYRHSCWNLHGNLVISGDNC